MNFCQNMDIIMQEIKLGITLAPVYWDELPEYRIKFNDAVIMQGLLNESTTFNWDLPAKDENTLSIAFLNKKDNDTQGGKDKALIIEQINIEGFKLNSFLYAGDYYPSYPEGYYQYAKEHNLSVEPVIKQTYLAFNGEWQLKISWPTFTWIHQTENLGWLYEVNI